MLHPARRLVLGASIWRQRRAGMCTTTLLTTHCCCSTSTTDAPSGPATTPGKVRVHIDSQVEHKKASVEVPLRLTLMEVIRDVARMDMEAACDGTCACSTCHVIFDEASYKKLLDTPSEDEMDMLDLAPAVTKTSRLSCQVVMTPELDDISITIPDETENQMR